MKRMFQKIRKELAGYLYILILICIPIIILLAFFRCMFAEYAEPRLRQAGDDNCYYLGSDIGGYTPLLDKYGRIDCDGVDNVNKRYKK